MSYHVDDTIAAIASAPGGAPRGIVRLSGPQVVACLQQCFQAADGRRLATRHQPAVIAGVLRIPPPLAELPCQLYLWPTQRSYTQQPSAELHTLGSPPLLEAALGALGAAGARLAEPGEFTMRAFLAGRLDLTQAEAVLGVIDAGSRKELEVALNQLAGGLASPLNQLRDQLLDLLAHLEAGLDFVEEDIEFISVQQLDGQLEEGAAQVARIAAQLSGRSESGGEVRIVLRGWPNVGKSSLLNALAGQAAALVSDRAGTTRDYVTQKVRWDGLSCLLIDTAGVELAGGQDGIAAAAQQMAVQQHQQAHLELLCLDASRELNAWEQRELARPSEVERLLVLTKADQQRVLRWDGPAMETSSRTGAGLEPLRQTILQRLAASERHASAVVAGTATRCRESLRLTAESLQRARRVARAQLGEELVAAELRGALDELGRVVGVVYTDDVLDRIFSRFCIGK